MSTKQAAFFPLTKLKSLLLEENIYRLQAAKKQKSVAYRNCTSWLNHLQILLVLIKLIGSIIHLSSILKSCLFRCSSEYAESRDDLKNVNFLNNGIRLRENTVV